MFVLSRIKNRPTRQELLVTNLVTANGEYKLAEKPCYRTLSYFFKETSQCCSEDHKLLSFVIMKFIYCMSTTVENIETCFLHEIVLYIPSIKYKFCALSKVHESSYVLNLLPLVGVRCKAS